MSFALAFGPEDQEYLRNKQHEANSHVEPAVVQSREADASEGTPRVNARQAIASARARVQARQSLKTVKEEEMVPLETSSSILAPPSAVQLALRRITQKLGVKHVFGPLCFLLLSYYSIAIAMEWKGFPRVLVHGLFLIPLYLYFTCIFRDPGVVPQGWKPSPSSTSTSTSTSTSNHTTHSTNPAFPSTGTSGTGTAHTALLADEEQGFGVDMLGGALSPTPCSKCQSLRPPRAHHCAQCGVCIQRMDHHCVWINNCVGYRTQRSFLLLLLYVALAVSISILILGSEIVCGVSSWRVGGVGTAAPHVLTGDNDAAFLGGGGVLKPNPEDKFLEGGGGGGGGAGRGSPLLVLYHLVLLALLAPTLYWVGAMLRQHLYLAARNLTSIENHGYAYHIDRARFILEKEVVYEGHAHHHGSVMGNLRVMFGRHIWMWPWPFYVPLGDSVNGETWVIDEHASRLWVEQQQRVEASVEAELMAALGPGAKA